MTDYLRAGFNENRGGAGDGIAQTLLTGGVRTVRDERQSRGRGWGFGPINRKKP